MTFQRNGPGSLHRIFDVDLDAVDREIEDLALGQFQEIPKQDFHLCAEVGLFRLFKFADREAVGSGRIDHFVDGLPKDLRQARGEPLRPSSLPLEGCSERREDREVRMGRRQWRCGHKVKLDPLPLPTCLTPDQLAIL
ncbi:hypothetical protein D3C72_869730 [compost metagenome]